jgi:hypothetical protein
MVARPRSRTIETMSDRWSGARNEREYHPRRAQQAVATVVLGLVGSGSLFLATWPAFDGSTSERWQFGVLGVVLLGVAVAGSFVGHGKRALFTLDDDGIAIPRVGRIAWTDVAGVVRYRVEFHRMIAIVPKTSAGERRERLGQRTLRWLVGRSGRPSIWEASLDRARGVGALLCDARDRIVIHPSPRDAATGSSPPLLLRRLRRSSSIVGWNLS